MLCVLETSLVKQLRHQLRPTTEPDPKLEPLQHCGKDVSWFTSRFPVTVRVGLPVRALHSERDVERSLCTGPGSRNCSGG